MASSFYPATGTAHDNGINYVLGRNLNITGRPALQGAKRLYFDLTTRAAAADVISMGGAIVGCAWEAATASDGASMLVSPGGHPSAIGIVQAGGAAVTGVLMVYWKGGKRPAQTDTDTITTLTFGSRRQEKFRRRASRQQRAFYAYMIGEASYTFDCGIPNAKNAYWVTENTLASNAVVLDSSTGVVTITPPDAGEYEGQVIVEFGA